MVWWQVCRSDCNQRCQHIHCLAGAVLQPLFTDLSDTAVNKPGDCNSCLSSRFRSVYARWDCCFCLLDVILTGCAPKGIFKQLASGSHFRTVQTCSGQTAKMWRPTYRDIYIYTNIGLPAILRTRWDSLRLAPIVYKHEAIQNPKTWKQSAPQKRYSTDGSVYGRASTYTSVVGVSWLV